VGWSFKIASLFGIPIRLHWSLLVFLGLVAAWGGGLAGLALTGAVFTSVVLHELGHALTARRMGMPIADISLYPFGGMARLLGVPRTTRDEILVAAAGPAVSLLLALAFAGLAALSELELLRRLAEVNGMLAAFNLLPALPMDGGRILRAWLARRRGFYRATRLAARVARVLALCLGVAGLFLSPWLVALAFLMFLMTGAEEHAAEVRRFLGDPGYQDVPTASWPPWVGGQTLEGTWSATSPPEPAAPDTVRQVFRDAQGRKVIVEIHRS
jgi:Zn-dependent protease